MRLPTLLAVCLSIGYSHKSNNPLKTKKYKCIEIEDDMEVQVIPKTVEPTVRSLVTYKQEASPQSAIASPATSVRREKRSWQQIDEEEFRTAGSAQVGSRMSEEEIETPQAHKVTAAKTKVTEQVPVQKPQTIPRDKEGRPLLLSPEHCKQVKRYANSYGVTDVLAWVGRNCSFAKMFLPTATCEDINALVASCYKNKYL